MSITEETLKITFKPLTWKNYKGFDKSHSQTVCSTITSFGYADVSKTQKGYRAFFENSGKHFDSLEEAKEYIKEVHQENILQFIEP